MLRLAVVFLIVALIAGALSLLGLEDTAMKAARLTSVVFFMLVVMLFGISRSAPTE